MGVHASTKRAMQNAQHEHLRPGSVFVKRPVRLNYLQSQKVDQNYYEGYLKKRGHFVRTWKRRYFVMTRSEMRMAYFRTRNDWDSGERPLGEHQVNVISLWPGKENGIEIVSTGGKVFYLKTPSVEDATRIMYIFNAASKANMWARESNGRGSNSENRGDYPNFGGSPTRRLSDERFSPRRASERSDYRRSNSPPSPHNRKYRHSGGSPPSPRNPRRSQSPSRRNHRISRGDWAALCRLEEETGAVTQLQALWRGKCGREEIKERLEQERESMDGGSSFTSDLPPRLWDVQYYEQLRKQQQQNAMSARFQQDLYTLMRTNTTLTANSTTLSRSVFNSSNHHSPRRLSRPSMQHLCSADRSRRMLQSAVLPFSNIDVGSHIGSPFSHVTPGRIDFDGISEDGERFDGTFDGKPRSRFEQSRRGMAARRLQRAWRNWQSYDRKLHWSLLHAKPMLLRIASVTVPRKSGGSSTTHVQVLVSLVRPHSLSKRPEQISLVCSELKRVVTRGEDGPTATGGRNDEGTVNAEYETTLIVPQVQGLNCVLYLTMVDSRKNVLGQAKLPIDSQKWLWHRGGVVRVPLLGVLQYHPRIHKGDIARLLDGKGGGSSSKLGRPLSPIKTNKTEAMLESLWLSALTPSTPDSEYTPPFGGRTGVGGGALGLEDEGGLTKMALKLPTKAGEGAVLSGCQATVQIIAKCPMESTAGLLHLWHEGGMLQRAGWRTVHASLTIDGLFLYRHPLQAPAKPFRVIPSSKISLVKCPCARHEVTTKNFPLSVAMNGLTYYTSCPPHSPFFSTQPMAMAEEDSGAASAEMILTLASGEEVRLRAARMGTVMGMGTGMAAGSIGGNVRRNGSGDARFEGSLAHVRTMWASKLLAAYGQGGWARREQGQFRD